MQKNGLIQKYAQFYGRYAKFMSSAAIILIISGAGFVLAGLYFLVTSTYIMSLGFCIGGVLLIVFGFLARRIWGKIYKEYKNNRNNTPMQKNGLIQKYAQFYGRYAKFMSSAAIILIVFGAGLVLASLYFLATSTYIMSLGFCIGGVLLIVFGFLARRIWSKIYKEYKNNK